MRILTVPGYTGSGPEHWQSLWEQRSPVVTRVLQRNWDRPVRREWVAALDRAVQADETPAILVAHSLGCATVAHWFTSPTRTRHVVGALLVAPADVDRPGWPREVVGFAPMPMERLAAESIVVASSDDPWVGRERAGAIAEAWGSRLVSAGRAGHMDSAAGLGPWLDGWRLLRRLVQRCGGTLPEQPG